MKGHYCNKEKLVLSNCLWLLFHDFSATVQYLGGQKTVKKSFYFQFVPVLCYVEFFQLINYVHRTAKLNMMLIKLS